MQVVQMLVNQKIIEAIDRDDYYRKVAKKQERFRSLDDDWA